MLACVHINIYSGLYVKQERFLYMDSICVRMGCIKMYACLTVGQGLQLMPISAHECIHIYVHQRLMLPCWYMDLMDGLDLAVGVEKFEFISFYVSSLVANLFLFLNQSGQHIIWLLGNLKNRNIILNQFDRADSSGQCLPDVVCLSGVVCLSEFIEFPLYYLPKFQFFVGSNFIVNRRTMKSSGELLRSSVK